MAMRATALTRLSIGPGKLLLARLHARPFPSPSVYHHLPLQTAGKWMTVTMQAKGNKQQKGQCKRSAWLDVPLGNRGVLRGLSISHCIVAPKI